MWRRFIPFLLWWPQVNRLSLRADGLAALSGAVVALPQGVAFAAIAGLPPEYGLYAAMAPVAIAALFGSSLTMISGPTTAISIVLFSSLSTMATPGSATFVYFALTLTFMVGVIQLAMGLARLGHLVNFISDSVVIGFSAGAAILIIVSQMRDVLGVDLPRGLNIQQTLFALYAHIADVNWMSVLVALVSALAGLLSRRLLPAVPFMIVAIVIGSLCALLLNTYFYASVELIGVRAQSIPPLSQPGFDLETWQHLAPASFAVAFLALTQSVSVARAWGARMGVPVDPNQEFIGQGLSNLCGAFLSGYVSAGSFNRSGVNYEAGARTPLASVISVLILIVILFAVAPLLSYLPKAATAGVLFLVAIGIIDTTNIRKILRTSPSDSVVLIITFLATVLLAVDFAILLGVMVSIVIFLNRSSQPVMQVQMPDPRNQGRRFNMDPALIECPQMKVVHIDGALFFGAANYVGEALRALFYRNPEQRHLLILARSINFIDTVGAGVLARENRRRRALGGGLYFHQMRNDSQAMLQRGGFMEEIGAENFFENKGEAIAVIFEKLDRQICAQCTRRVFNECKTLARPQREHSVPVKVLEEFDPNATIKRYAREPAR